MWSSARTASSYPCSTSKPERRTYMSLPKRDGVHDRYYLIHKPDTAPEVLAEATLCIQDVLNGTACENHSGLSDRGAKPQRNAVSP